MKLVVLGSNGQLGTDICDTLLQEGHDVVRLTHADIEISNPESVSRAFGGKKLDAVVNTAAMHHVERCEDDPSRAFAINAVGVRNLVRTCDENGAYFLHISTDYVFDGAKGKPYVESDAPRPLNVYGNSKLAGEHFVLTQCREGAVLRVSGVFGSHPCRAKGGMNFVQLMLKLAGERPEIRVVDDEILTPTYTDDIARQVSVLLKERTPGLFHGTAQGECSWFDFAKEIFAMTRTKANLQPARPGEFPAKVPRPRYSVLDNAGLKKAGLDMMPMWQRGLRSYLAEVGAL